MVGSTFKAQRENPEMFVRNTDPVLKGAKQRLEQLTQVHTLVFLLFFFDVGRDKNV